MTQHHKTPLRSTHGQFRRSPHGVRLLSVVSIPPESLIDVWIIWLGGGYDPTACDYPDEFKSPYSVGNNVLYRDVLNEIDVTGVDYFNNHMAILRYWSSYYVEEYDHIASFQQHAISAVLRGHRLSVMRPPATNLPTDMFPRGLQQLSSAMGDGGWTQLRYITPHFTHRVLLIFDCTAYASSQQEYPDLQTRALEYAQWISDRDGVEVWALANYPNVPQVIWNDPFRDPAGSARGTLYDPGGRFGAASWADAYVFILALNSYFQDAERRPTDYNLRYTLVTHP